MLEDTKSTHTPKKNKKKQKKPQKKLVKAEIERISITMS